MARMVALILAVLAGFLVASAQNPTPDSLSPVRGDTLYVIPAGPVAGTFTTDARLTVSDTVAGWAKVLIEGWVPVGAVLARMIQRTAALPDSSRLEIKPSERRQCAAMTSKGTRCKRKSTEGSIYCWQHQK